MATNKNEPARNVHLLETLRVNANAIIEEIFEIDYCLLAYKKELARAQPHVSGSLVLNFIPQRRIRDNYDIEPAIAHIFNDANGKWVLRKLVYVPGELHFTKILSKSGKAIQQETNVISLLRGIDRLFQARAKLIELTRPMRQTTNGIISHTQKRRRDADDTIDKAAAQLKIDWTINNAATIAVKKQIVEREARAVRKQERQEAARKIMNAS